MVKTSISDRSPLSPTRSPADAFTWWRSLLFALAIVFTVLVASLIFGVAYAALYGTASIVHPTPAVMLLGQVVVYVPVLVLLTLGLPRLAHRSLRDLGLRAPTPAEIAWGVGGAIAMGIAIEAIGAFEANVLHVKVSETAVDVLKATRGTLTIVFSLFACIIAPFFEEFVFRGFLFNALLRYLGAGWAAVLSGIVFGLAHADPHSLGAVLPLAAGGIVLAYVYYRTGALTASMIAHAGFNTISVIGLLFLKAA